MARIGFTYVFATCILSFGCSSGNKNIPASIRGSVSYKGAPVTGGTLALYAKQGGGVYQIPIGADGTFSYEQLPEGEMAVTVDTEFLNPNTKTPEYKGASGRGPGPATQQYKGKGMSMSPVPSGANVSKTGGGTYVKIPPIYKSADKSPLRVTLKAGDNKQDFELKD